MISIYKICLFTIFLAFELAFGQINPNLVEIKDYFGINQCIREIASEEVNCHKQYLDSFDTITGERGPNQESDQYKWMVCCDIWRYYDCISDSLEKECSQPDRDSFESFPDTPNAITVYCTDYPYHTYRCWRFPLWAVLLCVLTATLVLVGAGIGLWFWKRNQITYWRYRRKY